jgi:acetate---CoA ligase (ADP-forming)
LKIVSRSITHKTEAGGVSLGLADEIQLRLAWEGMQGCLERKAPGFTPESFLVEEMLPVQLELMVGVRRDDVFGPLLVVGLGGIFVELFRDLSMRPVPVSPGQVREMIDELKSAPLFQGFRGSASVDVKRLSEVISRFSRLAWELTDQFREMEINPLIICTDGRIAAADALFIR